MMFCMLIIVFQYKPVQTWAAKKAANYLSEQLNTKVDIASLYIKPFSAVVLDSLYVLDKQQDTLVSIPKLTVDLNGFSLFSSIKKHIIDFKLIELDNGSFYLKNEKDNISNLQFVLDYFQSTDTTKTKPGKPWNLVFEKTVVNNFHFRYKDQTRNVFTKAVNFDDIDVRNFSVTVLNMDLKNHLFKGDVRNMTLKEKSGFYLKNFTSMATVDSNQILVQHLFIQTPNSTLKDYFRMNFKGFKDFDDFENKIHMDGDFKSSHISSTDISYFAPSLKKVTFELGVDGRIKGLVNNLKATNLLVTTAQATYIKGDFSLRGLPDWDNTFLELKFEQIATNKKDMDYLFGHFTGDPKAKAPDILSKFGNINFTGRFTGLQNDFVAYGTFKTALGRFDPDINLKISKAGTPTYSGKINAYDFALGKLLDQDVVGRTTFNATINGSGDALKNLDEKISARIKYFDFKNYSYNNLVVNGTFAKKIAAAKISINDKNIKLDLDGSMDLNPTLPVYDFTASVNDAQLRKLNLLNDTITFTSRLNAKFSGNDLKNFEGKISLSPTRVIDPRNNYLIDTLSLQANGKGDSRTISFISDFADGSIKGSYDLATLPAYFETIVKKYIPSLKLKIAEPKPQNFAFNLTLKNLDPITAMFAPGLKVPDRGSFVGKFNSNDKTATINGYIKTINYGTTVFHDLILDESTTDDQMDINVALNRIDLTDKLFIKNINITNFLKRDSLNFNVKLADKDATNQLDLYGLINFGPDTTARLTLLPSDIILEHQNWRLQKNTSIRLLDGKTQVSGFVFSNGQQNVKIDGLISDSPTDKLKVTFDNFNMHTLDQLTKAANVSLTGILKGDVFITGVTKNPGVDAHLGIDSLRLNKTLVGNVKIESSLDNDRKQANVKLNILNRGLETLNIGGTYALGKENADKLDVDIKMNQSEAIILEPFVKDLVSNLKGTISTDLKLTGTASKPQLNGEITLNNTGVTVNYLKTAYTVNDKLTVKNSVVNIDKMVMKDAHGGEGAVTGTVDLNDLSNPDIEATVIAKNLMALNTNFKDNHLYFGTAYANGTFKFNGPVDNMNIDITASTGAGTVFNIPLNTSSTVGDYDFIRFVSHKDTAKAVAKPRSFNGITLNFDLTIDEKTTVKITTDYGILEGTGQAKNLNLHINDLGDFDMYGSFLITSGKFDFTAKNFINKIFTVNQGGTISWSGNPTNAQINLNAIYEVRTDPKNLYSAAGVTPPNPKVVLVQAELLITKSLIQPNIDFDFNFPTDPSIKDDLGTYLADNNNRSTQALSIIVRREFAAATGSNFTNQVVNTAGSAFSEFAFNKLNNVIAQSNVIKNFDLNIRSYNDLSATYKIFNQRLILNGSVFSNTGSSNIFNSGSVLNQNPNNLTTDFEGSYLVRKDGSLAAHYSYRVLNATTLNTIDQLSAQYVNGLGLVYQRDFDTFGEFLRNFFRRTNRNNTPPPAKPTAGSTPPPDALDENEDQ
jgi:hypothetical protein